MRILAVLAALWLLSGCGIERWINGGQSNAAPPAKLTHFTPSLAIRTVWSHSTGDGTAGYDLDLQPAFAHGVLYVGNANGRVAAYAAATGRQLWHTALGHHITGGVSVGDGLVVVGTRRGLVVAMHSANGQIAWQAQAPSEVLAPPTFDHRRIIVASLDGRLTALGVGHGRRLWTVGHVHPALELFLTARPAVDHGIIDEGYANGVVVALRAADGRRLWTSTIAEPRGGDAVERLVDVNSPIIAQSVVYTDSYHGNVVALEARSGRILWSHPASSDRAPCLGRQTLYVVTTHSRVLALASASGGTLWDQKVLLNRHLGAPALAGPAVVMGDYAGYVQWLSRRNGRLLARHRVSEGAIRAAPLVARVGRGLPYVFVLSTTGRLTAMRFKPQAS